MRETNKPYFEELGLSLEQENDKIAGLVETFEGVTHVEDIQDTIFCLKELSEDSKNSLTTGIIYKCADKINNGFIHPNIKEKIAEGISRELFPVLFNNLDKNKEKLNSHDLMKMISSIHDTNNSELRGNVAYLFRYYVDPTLKKFLIDLTK